MTATPHAKEVDGDFAGNAAAAGGIFAIGDDEIDARAP